MCATHGEFILKFSHGSIIYTDIFEFVIITRLNHSWRRYKSVHDFAPECLKNWTFFTTTTTTTTISTHISTHQSYLPLNKESIHSKKKKKKMKKKKLEEDEEKGPIITFISLSYQDNVRGSTA